MIVVERVSTHAISSVYALKNDWITHTFRLAILILMLEKTGDG